MFKTCGIWFAALAIAVGGLSEKPHPRLWFPKTEEGKLRDQLAKDPLAMRLQTAVLAEAERVLSERTCRYEIPDGKRLLRESRLALHNIMHSAWAWRMGGEEKFRLRAIAELEAACGLKDWNPSHFLDTAEMATAVATGYDWLYQSLTPEQRAMCERAIIDKALKPAKGVYDKGGWWAAPRNNWSQVCGSGIALAAAAIAGKDEGLSEELFDRGLKLVEKCSAFYQPDGMYPEGPGYWHYGTNYHVMMLAACGPLDRKTAEAPILQKAGDAIMHLTSSTRLTYNFADGHASLATPSPAQCWLAGRYKDAGQTQHIRALYTRALDEGKGRNKNERYGPLSVLWLPPAPVGEPTVPHAAVFNGEQAMAMFRKGWSDKDAWFAIKGGTAAASHGHMDVGSFVYDAHGVRWFHDLGSDDYNMPGYFGKERWKYYRMQNRSHNTLEINGKLQNAAAKPCPIIASSLTDKSLSATFDLSSAYVGSAGKVQRTSAFDKETGNVRIEDTITAPKGEIIWRALTDAEAEVRGNEVILKKNGKQITLHRISDVGTWSIVAATPPTSAEKQNEEFRAVVLTVPKADKISLSIEIRP